MRKTSVIKKERVLKILISAGILAIFFSLYLQYGKPYIKELSLERQDAVRIKDLDTLDSIFKNILSASSTQYLGHSNTIYLSIPSDDPTCANLDLPSVPDGWAYHCASQADYIKTNGAGWIPVDISISTNSLPVDPLNTPETLNYYAYVASSVNETVATSTATTTVSMQGPSGYAITAVLDSKKYLKEKAQEDNGTDDIRYEVGDNKIWSNAQGLVEYWSFNKNDGNLIINDLNPDNKISLNGVSILRRNFEEGRSINLNGKNESLDLGSNPSLSPESISLVIKINPSKVPQNSPIVNKGTPGYAAFSYGLFLSLDKYFFEIKNKDNELVNVSFGPIQEKKWYSIAGTFDNETKFLRIFVNGKLVAQKISISGIDYSYNPSLHLGGDGQNYFNGLVDDVKIYNKVLNTRELQKIN